MNRTAWAHQLERLLRYGALVGIASAVGLACSSGGLGPGGGVVGGTGGSGAVGGGPATGGSTSPGGATGLTGGMASGGYSTGTGGADTRYRSGPWAGYVWTAVDAGSTISPAGFDGHQPGTPYCASGSVGPKSDFGGFAMIGYNLNQAADSDIAGTWTPSGSSGLTVSFTNSGGSALRVQIQGPNGATDENDRWCYSLTGSGGTITIPWASFNTYCWGGAGTTYYSGQSLQAVALLIPGDNASAVSFSICLNAFSLA
jgi:hypothetical protein